MKVGKFLRQEEREAVFTVPQTVFPADKQHRRSKASRRLGNPLRDRERRSKGLNNKTQESRVSPRSCVLMAILPRPVHHCL